MTAPLTADLVLETATAPGTGQFTLNGAVAGRRSFAAAFPDGGSVGYFADDGNTTEWGVGRLSVGTPATLSRDTVLGTTAATTTVVNFQGTVRVWCCPPAQLLPLLDLQGTLSIAGLVVSGTGSVGDTKDWDSQDILNARTALAKFMALDEGGTLSGSLKVKGAVSLDEGKPVEADILEPATAGGLVRNGAGNSYDALPSGSIILWYGAASAIPSGWVACDGENGTPDLRDKVAIGMGTDGVLLGTVIGSPSSKGNTDDHTLTSDEIPAHTHGYGYRKWSDSGRDTSHSIVADSTGADGTYTTTSTGGSKGHSHSITLDVRQPSLYLWYIMKQ